MKLKYLFAAAALAAVVLPAQATYCSNGAKDWPKCTPPKPAPTPSPSPTPSNTTTTVNNQSHGGASNSSATSSSRSGAISGATSGSRSNATVGNVSTGPASASVGNTSASGGSNTLGDMSLQAGGGGGASVNDTSRSSWDSNMYVLPAPVFTPPLPKVDCPQANVKNDAFAVGWNFLSVASGSVNTDNCTAILLYNSYISTCKYNSAQQVLDLLSTKVLPDFKTQTNVYVDLGTRECEILKQPVAAPPAVVTYTMPRQACATPRQPAKGKPKRRTAPPPVACPLPPKASRG